jgi:hypothetical protein
VIVFSHKKGKKDLLPFDAKNIVGRAGRFYRYFTGRVFVLDSKFPCILKTDDHILIHTNYEMTSQKKEQDLFLFPTKYLNSQDLKKKRDLSQQIATSGIPLEIITHYKTISPSSKLVLYTSIKGASLEESRRFVQISKSCLARRISHADIQFLIGFIAPIVPPSDPLKDLITRKDRRQQYSVVTYLVSDYFYNGFRGLVDYNKNVRQLTTDKAIRIAGLTAFSLLRYDLVKYIGLLDTVFRQVYSSQNGIVADEAPGFSSLLCFLEYGGFTEEAKKASDIGVPFELLKMYDGQSGIILDEFEQKVKSDVDKLLSASAK